MSIQASVTSSLSENGGKLRTIRLLDEDGASTIPSDILLNLQNCTPAATTLGARCTLNMTNGSLSGTLTTTTQCQVLLYNVTITGNLVLDNTLAELVNCDIDNAQISLTNGSKILVRGSTYDHVTGGVAGFVGAGNSHFEVYDTPVNTNGDGFDLNSCSLVLGSSAVTSSAGKGLDLDGSRVEVVKSDISGFTAGVELSGEAAAVISGSTLSGNPALSLDTGSTCTLVGLSVGDTISVPNAAIVVNGNSALDIVGALSIKNNTAGVCLDVLGLSRVAITNIGTLEGFTSAIRCAGGGSVQVSSYTTLNALDGDCIDVDGGQVCCRKGGSITSAGGGNLSANVSGGEFVADGGATLEDLSATGGSLRISRFTTVGVLTINGASCTVNDITNAVTNLDADSANVAAKGLTFTDMDADSSDLGFHTVTLTNAVTIDGGSSGMQACTTGDITLGASAEMRSRNSSHGTISGFTNSIVAGSWAFYD